MRIEDFDNEDFETELERKKDYEAYLMRVEHDDFKWLASHKQGRRVLYRLLAHCGVFRNPFTPDTSATAFNCGMMSVGQKLWADLNELAPERIELMITEHKEHESRKPEHRGEGKQ